MGDLLNEAYDLKNVGRSKFSVKFNSRDAANSIVGRFMEMRDHLFPHSDWIAYIPNYKIQRTCISWDINNFDNDEEIQENLSPPPGWLDSWPKVVAVKGISKPDKTSDRTNSDTSRRRKASAYIITFEGSIYPDRASLYGKIINLKPYIQKVIRCHLCQRFGHVEEQCRSAKSSRICAKCAAVGHCEAECSSLLSKCINCTRKRLEDSAHTANSQTCPVFVENRKIKQLMTILGISNRDAGEFYRRLHMQPHYTVSKVDWSYFAHRLEESSIHLQDYRNSMEFSNPSKAYAELERLIHEALVEAGARKPGESTTPRRPLSPWWDDECREIIQDKLFAYKRYKLFPNSEYLALYQKESRIANRKLRKIKKKKFKSFCNALNIKSEPRKVWNILRAFNNSKRIEDLNRGLLDNQKLKVLNNFDKTISTNIPSAICNRFINNIASPFKKLISNLPTKTLSNKELLDDAISKTEFLASLKFLSKKKTSLGADLITWLIINKLPTAVLEILLKLFNDFFTQGIIPSSWKKYILVFIPKGDGTNLRPISLANNLAKLYEKILHHRIEWWAENAAIIPFAQRGFRLASRVHTIYLT
ncbi:uncharacterized protein LOC116843310 isoform X3 [Odontomachus brunneus]|uniref:uncharacterized protein LOC116843310 isoform X3 n=1 Tax=Odontomachus brunneus TaxID=486640 RepID=UPI0013F1CF5C|nr:uncharacterized protein LOC116843310 isoform X3 [Odontomachus brunneus]